MRRLESIVVDFSHSHQAFFSVPLVQHGRPCCLHDGANLFLIRNESGNAENLVSRCIGRFGNYLSLDNICNEVIGESDLDPSINKALDNQQVKVELSSKDSLSETFEIDYSEQLQTALDFEKNLKFIIFTILAPKASDEVQTPSFIDPFQVMMRSSSLINKQVAQRATIAHLRTSIFK